MRVKNIRKYHKLKDYDKRQLCMGQHCLHCWFLGRKSSLYGGDTITPLPPTDNVYVTERRDEK